MGASLEGWFAGFSIAIPLGALSILIVNTALDHGFGKGFAVGAGTAPVDLLCAALAVFAGTAMVAIIAPYFVPLLVTSGIPPVCHGRLRDYKVPKEILGLQASEGEARDRQNLVQRCPQLIII